MASRLTEAGRRVLATIEAGALLKNADEISPQWWIEGGRGVHKETARSLVRNGYVDLCGHIGGQPGLDKYSITASGRAALEKRDE